MSEPPLATQTPSSRPGEKVQDASEDAGLPELRVLTCNVAEANHYAAEGAKVYVLDLAGDRVKALVRSHSGRWVAVWRPYTKLRNFRVTTVVPGAPAYERITRDYPIQNEDLLQERCASANERSRRVLG